MIPTVCCPFCKDELDAPLFFCIACGKDLPDSVRKQVRDAKAAKQREETEKELAAETAKRTKYEQYNSYVKTGTSSTSYTARSIAYPELKWDIDAARAATMAANAKIFKAFSIGSESTWLGLTEREEMTSEDTASE